MELVRSQKNQLQKELFASIPLERLLLETDAPFLTPAPFRGKYKISQNM